MQIDVPRDRISEFEPLTQTPCREAARLGPPARLVNGAHPTQA